MTVAGRMPALGIAPQMSAGTLAGSPVPTTLAGHPFRKEEGEVRPAQEIRFATNPAMLGGLLPAMVDRK